MTKQSYEGAAVATFLRGFAPVVAILSTVAAIVVWSTAGQPHVVLDGGEPYVSTGVNAATILAGFLVLGEGILLALLTYAIGVTVDHLIAIRRQIDSGTARLVATDASIGMSMDEPTRGLDSLPVTYRLVLVSVGQDAKGVKQILEAQSNWHWSERELRREGAGTILGSSLTEARAHALREALAARGVVAEIEADTR
jgi:hypothetical protein